MAQLAKQKVSLDALGVNYSAASAGGDTFPNTGRELLLVTNTSGATRTVTVTAQQSCEYGDLHDADADVPDGAADEPHILGPFSPDRFSNTNGECEVGYDSATGVQVAVIYF